MSVSWIKARTTATNICFSRSSDCQREMGAASKTNVKGTSTSCDNVIRLPTLFRCRDPRHR